MSMFTRQLCSVCGKRCGTFANNLLADGYLCSRCAGKLSPWLTDYHRLTAAQIRQHLAYRRANRQMVEQFTVTDQIAEGEPALILDRTNQLLILTGDPSWRHGNPDILAFSQLLAARTVVTPLGQVLLRVEAASPWFSRVDLPVGSGDDPAARPYGEKLAAVLNGLRRKEPAVTGSADDGRQ
jgi:hypothetical protein